MRRIFVVLALLSLLPQAATAFTRVEDRGAFMTLVEGRVLTRPLIRLNVLGNGVVSGVASARDVQGQWSWQGNNFCWEFTLNGQPYQPNICLVVELDGDRLKFSEDGNPSNSYTFRIR